MVSLLFQTLATANVENRDKEKERGRANENQIKHGGELPT
jgi:hypothetical protein